VCVHYLGVVDHNSAHYPLPANTLTQQQCDPITAPILQAGLPCSYLSPRTGIRPHRRSRARHSAFPICYHRAIHSGFYGTTHSRDRPQRTDLILTLCRICWISDQMLAPIYMVFYEHIQEADRGHQNPTFSLSRQRLVVDTTVSRTGNERPPTPSNQSVPPLPPSPYDLRYHNRLRHQY
jgi:hypothetical protein